MKKYYLFFLIISFLCSCGVGNEFGKRRYRNGWFVQKRSKAYSLPENRIKEDSSINQIASIETLKDSIFPETAFADDSGLLNNIIIPHKKITIESFSIIKEEKEVVTNTYKKIKRKLGKGDPKADTSSDRLGKISFNCGLFSIIGIVISVLGVLIPDIDYVFFALLFLISLILLIIGFICGERDLHKKRKAVKNVNEKPKMTKGLVVVFIGIGLVALIFLSLVIAIGTAVGAGI